MYTAKGASQRACRHGPNTPRARTIAGRVRRAVCRPTRTRRPNISQTAERPLFALQWTLEAKQSQPSPARPPTTFVFDFEPSRVRVELPFAAPIDKPLLRPRSSSSVAHHVRRAQAHPPAARQGPACQEPEPRPRAALHAPHVVRPRYVWPLFLVILLHPALPLPCPSLRQHVATEPTHKDACPPQSLLTLPIQPAGLRPASTRPAAPPSRRPCAPAWTPASRRPRAATRSTTTCRASTRASPASRRDKSAPPPRGNPRGGPRAPCPAAGLPQLRKKLGEEGGKRGEIPLPPSLFPCPSSPSPRTLQCPFMATEPYNAPRRSTTRQPCVPVPSRLSAGTSIRRGTTRLEPSGPRALGRKRLSSPLYYYCSEDHHRYTTPC